MAAYEKAGESDEWYTPRYLFDAMAEQFDLDVAAPIEGPRHVPCYNWYHRIDNGLCRRWYGFVWMNPPFGHQRHKRAWLARFFEHGNGIALVPDRTSAPWFQEFAPRADAICWVSPKIKFERPDGTLGESPGTGTALLAAGERAAAALDRSGLGMVTGRRGGAEIEALRAEIERLRAELEHRRELERQSDLLRAEAFTLAFPQGLPIQSGQGADL